MDKDLIGKQIKLIWEDKEKLSIREGTVENISNKFITIKTKNKVELIPIKRIFRIELKGGNGK